MGWPLSPPAVTAMARTRLPNSTAATKLFPLVPYHFFVAPFVPGYGLAPNDASDPHTAEVNPTGMLGPASLKGWTISLVRRWNRFISPQGTFQLPKSVWSLATAAWSDWRGCSAGARWISSPQNTASEVATESTAQRRSQARSSSIWPANFCFKGFDDRVSSYARMRAGSGLSNHVR